MSGSKNSQGIKVLVAGSVLQLFLGVIYVWSVFVVPVQKFFNWEINNVKFTSNIMLCCFVIGILIAGRLQAKVKASFIVLAGGLMMAVGMFATSVLPASAPFWSIWLTYGIIGGLGVGLAYNTIISCAQKWFPKKRGLATGISVFAFGFSSVIFAPLIEELVNPEAKTVFSNIINFESIGLDMTLKILAGAFTIATLALFWLIKLPENTAGAPVDFGAQKQYTTGEMLKTVDFYLIVFSQMFLTAAFFIINPSLKLLAPMHGLDASFGITLVMIAGLANSAGRLVVPLLGEKIGKRGAVLTILLITSIGTASLCFAQGAFFVIAIAAVAFCYGGSSGVYPLVTSEHFGLKNIGSNYGMVMVGFMMSVLVAPNTVKQLFTGDKVPAAGNSSAVKYVMADNVWKFIALACVAAVGALLILVLIFRAKKANETK